MTIYCWGSTTYGQLGLGGIEEDLILSPRKLDWPHASGISMIACGTMHTLLVTKSGQIFSCGNNDHGQLGQEISRKRPHAVQKLENYVVTQVVCGAAHSMAINEWGQLFTWGSNKCGQLARDTMEIVNPIAKIVKALATKHIVQIASGHYHSMALTNNGDLYAWGSNMYGQLGIGNFCDKVHKPTLISSITGIPIAYITCGANHSFAISKSGTVFGWGKNLFGQLGLNDDQSRPYPTQLKTLRSRGIRFIACGDDFSVFLTASGGVYSCGAGTYGQLGHGTNSNDFLPRMVVELMGTSCTQISCGRQHTLTFVPTRGRVYGFGLGSSGQLGHRLTENSKIPQVVIGPWISPSGTCLMDNCTNRCDDIVQTRSAVNKIFSGGDHSFSICCDQNMLPDDYRIYDKRRQITSFSVELARMCATIAKDDTLDLDLMASIEMIFKSISCFNASFLFENMDDRSCNAKFSGVNTSLAQEAFDLLRKIENDTLKQLIWDSITNELLKSLNSSPADVETLRIYLVLPLYHEFSNSKNYQNLHTPFSLALLRLKELPQKCLSQWWATETKEYFERMVEIFKSVVIHIFNFNPLAGYHQKRFITYEPNIEIALNVMKIFFRINHFLRKQKISYELFQMPELTEFSNLEHDYVNWLVNRNPNQFYLCNYSFIFDAKAKTLLLQTDQSFQMHSAMQNASATPQSIFRLFSGQPPDIYQFLVLNVSRENIVEDTLREIMRYGTNDLKKPLKVKFHGEEAEDAGGVRKEFFMLLLKDLLDLKYGMFKEFEDSRAIWFADYTFEDTLMFKLIGTLCGLAIYNFTIINLPFPLALYKKLLNESVDLNDLHDLSPTLGKSLQSLLDYTDNDFEEVFCLTFELSREFFGETNVVCLKPNGDKIPVTLENREEYVNLYVDFILNKSVEKQFMEFYEGFTKVCGGRVMELFKPHELMAVVVGNEDYDWYALESEARYNNGYTSGDQTIRWFWEVFHELPLAEKKKFLLFLTGSDRIPILGMKAIRIYFQPTIDDRCLPVAHTCFNLLDLPRYNTKERLKYKLCQAIQQTQGFSIV